MPNGTVLTTTKPSHPLFMEKGYIHDADYIRAVLGWRQACDERGLIELQRFYRNYRMLNYLLKELMPWYDDQYDFGLLVS